MHGRYYGVFFFLFHKLISMHELNSVSYRLITYILKAIKLCVYNPKVSSLRHAHQPNKLFSGMLGQAHFIKISDSSNA